MVGKELRIPPYFGILGANYQMVVLERPSFVTAVCYSLSLPDEDLTTEKIDDLPKDLPRNILPQLASATKKCAARSVLATNISPRS